MHTTHPTENHGKPRVGGDTMQLKGHAIEVEPRKPDEITFWMSDKLPERFIKESTLSHEEKEATLKSFVTEPRLVAVKSTLGSFPKHHIDDLKAQRLTPTQYMKRLGEREGLNNDALNRALKDAFKDD